MPIIGAEPLQKTYYRLAVSMGGGFTDNVIITPDGLYTVYYIRNGHYYSADGRIPRVVVDYRVPQNSYILFDYSSDRSAKREKIFFFQVQFIKDITPNDAYRIAVEHGFKGTLEEWLESLRGEPGKSAYEVAVDAGYVGTVEDWLRSLVGPPGEPGKNAYELAVEAGYPGTIEDWFAEFGDTTYIKQDVDQLKSDVDEIEEHLTWVNGMIPSNPEP